MLPDKPWKPEAVLRLLASVLICLCAGSVLGSVLHYWTAGGKVRGWVFYPLAAGAVSCLAAAFLLLRRPFELETLMRRLVMWFVCFYGGIFFGTWVQKYGAPLEASTATILVGTLSFQGATLVLTGLFLREHDTTWGCAFGFGTHWRHALLYGLIVGCVFLQVGRLLQQLSAVALTLVTAHFPQLPLKPEEQQAVRALRDAVSWGARLSGGAVTIVLAPLGEELLFRGVLYPWIKRAGHVHLALWGSAALFALIHLNLMTFLPLFVLAVTLTLLYEWTGNLLAPIAAHSLFNALNLAQLYAHS